MSTANEENTHINLLWTGGWDSTFQLLQVLLIYKNKVTPYYMIHEKRPSTLKEIRVMKKIKDQIIKDYPYTKELFESTQFHSVDDISPNRSITSAYERLLKKCHAGTQYEWLARFCQEKGIRNMQLSIQAHLKPDPKQFTIQPFLKSVTIGGQEVSIIDQKFKETEEYELFNYFAFPLMKINKVAMNKVAVSMGWKKIMDMTWFCHYPTRHDKPCGLCKPCNIALDESFGWRIPVGRRMISWFYRKLLWPIKLRLRALLIRLGLFTPKSKRH